MKASQIMPAELITQLQGRRRIEEISQVLGERLGKVFGPLLVDIAWGLRGRQRFAVGSWAAGEKARRWERELGQSLAAELLAQEEPFVLEKYASQNPTREEAKASLFGARMLLVWPLADRRGVNGFIALYLAERHDLEYWRVWLEQAAAVLSMALQSAQELELTAAASRRAWRELSLARSGAALAQLGMVSQSSAMQRLKRQVEALALRAECLWLQGPQDSGRGLVAQALHRFSARSSRPLRVFDALALDPSLHRDELFGRSGSSSSLWNACLGGTLYLKNTEALAPAALAELARAWAAHSKDELAPAALILSSGLRLEDWAASSPAAATLAAAIGPAALTIPGLTERREDLPYLIKDLLDEAAARLHIPRPELAPDFVMEMVRRDWPGQVQELRQVLEERLLACNGRKLRSLQAAEDEGLARAGRPHASLEDATRAQIIKVLKRCQGRYYGPDGAAAKLGLHPSTLQGKMRKFGIKPEDYKNKD